MLKSPLDMPEVVVLSDLGRDYPALLKHVKDTGERVTSRIGQAYELLDLRLELCEPRRCLVGRAGMSDAFAYEEATQLLAGVYDRERLAALVPRAAELVTPETAYGPRTSEQLSRVVEELQRSPQSRRAVVYVGRPDDLSALDDPVEHEHRAGEVPCTMAWQFHRRAGFLHMTVSMRSWDLVWGLSYDVPSFVAVQVAVARALDCVTGRYVHHAGSAHVYDRHWSLETWQRSELFDVEHLVRTTWDGTVEAARAVLSQNRQTAT